MRDAIRCNDGMRILCHWRWNLPHFYNHRRHKYLILAVGLLTDVAGGVSQRLGQQLTWCRTVNPSGTPGGNLEGDLQMEHFNRIYKGA